MDVVCICGLGTMFDFLFGLGKHFLGERKEISRTVF